MAAGSRTEQATPKKLRDARKEGQAVRAVELPQSASLIAAVALLPVVIPSMGEQFLAAMRTAFTFDASINSRDAILTLGAVTRIAAMALAPLLAGIALVSVLSQLALIGRPNLWKLKPKPKNLHPKQGLKRIFSTQSIWELLRTILKVGSLALLATMLWQRGDASLILGPTPLETSLERLGGALQALFVQVAAIGLVIGIADSVWARYKFNRDLRMTKQETKEEHKQQEGDPTIKAEIRRKQASLSRTNMMAAIAGADVVVTNPTHLSVALAYGEEHAAPVVVAKGAGDLAMRIRSEARRNGVPVRENKPVARTLFRTVDVGEPIPENLYRAVAEILAALYQARKPRMAVAS